VLLAGLVIVGSAGSKGSGKSTLLNKLFDTDFGIGRSLGPHARPQGGVALCAAGGGGLVCVDYDAVGTGTEEAGTNGKFLALTTKLADAILLNLWSSDVGRNVPYNSLALQVRWWLRHEATSRSVNLAAPCTSEPVHPAHGHIPLPSF